MRLKRMLADRGVEIAFLKEITRQKVGECATAPGRVCPIARSVEPSSVRLLSVALTFPCELSGSGVSARRARTLGLRFQVRTS